MPHDESPPPPWPPRGLLLYRPRTSAAGRRRRRLFVFLAMLIGALVLWPIYPVAARIQPLVLGLPFGFAWVVGALVSMFALLLWFDRAGRDEEDG